MQLGARAPIPSATSNQLLVIKVASYELVIKSEARRSAVAIATYSTACLVLPIASISPACCFAERAAEVLCVVLGLVVLLLLFFALICIGKTRISPKHGFLVIN